MQILVVHNDVLKDEHGVEREALGQEFLIGLYGEGTYVQTSYNNNMRKQFASCGYTYDSTKNLFISPQPYPSWTLNANSDWESQTPKPAGHYHWNEDKQEWEEEEG